MTLYEKKVKSGYITLTRTFPLRDIYFLMRGFTFFAIFKLLTLNYFRELKIYKKQSFTSSRIILSLITKKLTLL